MAIDKASIFQCSILTGLRIPLEASKILHGSSGLCWCAGSHCTLQLQVMAVLLLPSHLYSPFAMPEIPTVTFRISLCQREALLSVWYSVMTAVFSCYFIKKNKHPFCDLTQALTTCAAEVQMLPEPAVHPLCQKFISQSRVSRREHTPSPQQPQGKAQLQLKLVWPWLFNDRQQFWLINDHID